MQAIEWCHFQWPWVTADPSFKVTVVLKGEYLQIDAFYRQFLYRTLIENHRHAIDRQASHTAYNPTALTSIVETFRKRRAGLSATAGLSCCYYGWGRQSCLRRVFFLFLSVQCNIQHWTEYKFNLASVRCPSIRRLRPTLWAQFWSDLH